MILATPRHNTYMLDHPDEITTFLMEEGIEVYEEGGGWLLVPQLDEDVFFVLGRDALLVSDSSWEVRDLDDIYEEYLLG